MYAQLLVSSRVHPATQCFPQEATIASRLRDRVHARISSQAAVILILGCPSGRRPAAVMETRGEMGGMSGLEGPLLLVQIVAPIEGPGLGLRDARRLRAGGHDRGIDARPRVGGVVPHGRESLMKIESDRPGLGCLSLPYFRSEGHNVWWTYPG